MELSIETLVGILIAVIILLAILVLLDIIPLRGRPLNAQSRIYLCCRKYLASECNDLSVICDGETMETIEDLRLDLNLDEEDLQRMCGCPEV